MPLGLYISVPFCKTKCTYCNFASDVFSRAVFENYVSRLFTEIQQSRETAQQMGCLLDREVDSIYFGGGTPTLLDVTQLRRVFVTIRQNFELQPGSEITVECAPGTLSQPMLDALVEFGVNRVSLGVQSFVDQEAASVGRLHRRDVVLNDIDRLRVAGIPNINVDLIAGLPHQTTTSWEQSLSDLISTGVPHASVYMLEVDEDSRLGRELIAGGQKYHAHFVPDDDVTADLYELACDRLNSAGIEQYEISNFARSGFESRHNLKYWTRQPYLGFGVDAHSMLTAHDSEVLAADHDYDREGHGFQPCRTESPKGTDGTAVSRALPEHRSGRGPVLRHRSHVSELRALRFSNPDSLESYLAAAQPHVTRITHESALEEAYFLGLRLNRGVDLQRLRQPFPELFADYLPVIDDLVRDGLLVRELNILRLTRRGRLLSNEVFEKFVSEPAKG